MLTNDKRIYGLINQVLTRVAMKPGIQSIYTPTQKEIYSLEFDIPYTFLRL